MHQSKRLSNIYDTKLISDRVAAEIKKDLPKPRDVEKNTQTHSSRSSDFSFDLDSNSTTDGGMLLVRPQDSWFQPINSNVLLDVDEETMRSIEVKDKRWKRALTLVGYCTGIVFRFYF
ncbi:2,3-bisphosphoglycerate-independent phosphoglycerate mutase [Acrasis kona]|uniref:2,3-bisphosphoglycerate-independent phosphoglycerate mutase n=1 Tax=Acrasis kona TaxID=1008807 RepID=A0AAW2ZHB8_9EUKA